MNDAWRSMEITARAIVIRTFAGRQTLDQPIPALENETFLHGLVPLPGQYKLRACAQKPGPLTGRLDPQQIEDLEWQPDTGIPLCDHTRSPCTPVVGAVAYRGTIRIARRIQKQENAGTCVGHQFRRSHGSGQVHVAITANRLVPPVQFAFEDEQLPRMFTLGRWSPAPVRRELEHRNLAGRRVLCKHSGRRAAELFEGHQWLIIGMTGHDQALNRVVGRSLADRQYRDTDPPEEQPSRNTDTTICRQEAFLLRDGIPRLR